MSEWTPQQFRGPADPENGLRELTERIGDLGRKTRDGLNHLLQASGILVKASGIQSADFDGDLDALNPGTTGWAMNARRAAFGSILLRPNSIGNDILTNPVIPAEIAVETTGWSNASGDPGSVQATTTLTAPTGCTKGLVSVNMYAQANHGAGEDYMRLYPEIGGVQGRPGGKIVHSGAGDQVNIGMSKLVVATTITVSARVWTTWTVGAAGDNIATITGSVLWLR